MSTALKPLTKLTRDQLNGLDESEYRDYCRRQLMQARQEQLQHSRLRTPGSAIGLFLFMAILAILANHFGFLNPDV
ncbi:MAG: hypothetical protein HYZ57_18225 [Acidobacteria bacterium]|nr:hypothetical protein [Acidobacteriota bacterium]MBI3281765.1 hypothetical protein [Acidobacteriota bacterium]